METRPTLCLCSNQFPEQPTGRKVRVWVCPQGAQSRGTFEGGPAFKWAQTAWGQSSGQTQCSQAASLSAPHSLLHGEVVPHLMTMWGPPQAQVKEWRARSHKGMGQMGELCQESRVGVMEAVQTSQGLKEGCWDRQMESGIWDSQALAPRPWSLP